MCKARQTDFSVCPVFQPVIWRDQKYLRMSNRYCGVIMVLLCLFSSLPSSAICNAKMSYKSLEW